MKTWIPASQASLFDLPAGIAAKDKGIEIAASQRASLVIEARNLAVEIAKRKGTVNADDIVEAMCERGYGPHVLGPATGSIFRDRRFKFTGQRIKSKRPWANANELRVWSLV